MLNGIWHLNIAGNLMGLNERHPVSFLCGNVFTPESMDIPTSSASRNLFSKLMISCLAIPTKKSHSLSSIPVQLCNIP